MTEKKSSHAATHHDNDPFKMLKADHQTVRDLYEAYENLVEDGAPAPERGELANNLCRLLQAHTELEEEVFYPALRETLNNPLLIDEAEVEHAVAKDLIEQIRGMQPDEPKYDATVIVLCEYVLHHIDEEENEIFKKARRNRSIDRDGLGSRMMSRKQELGSQQA